MGYPMTLISLIGRENQIREGVDPEEFDRSYEMELKFDAWFNFGLPADQVVFLNLNYKFNDPKSVIFRDPDDTVHTDRYFTINGFLIEFVGYDKYKVFEEKYANTPNYNILFFVNYFNISKEDFKFIFSGENNYHSITKPYKTEYVYGDDDMQRLLNVIRCQKNKYKPSSAWTYLGIL